MNTVSIYEIFKQFPDEDSARKFFEKRRWPNGASCPFCGVVDVAECKDHKPMAYRCRGCRRHFSVRTDTVLAEGKIGLHKWLLAIYMLHTARKGVSSVQMHKEIGVTQKTAWFLNHRIREAMAQKGGMFGGEVEVDETYVGGKEKNKHAAKKLRAGRGAVGKTAVMGINQREGGIKAFPVSNTDREVLQSEIAAHVEPGATVYTDSHGGYRGLKDYNHQVVVHSVGEYVRDQAHTNGIESFWALLKRGHYGIYHQMSAKHLHRYVDEFSHRHNAANLNTFQCIETTIDGMIGRRLSYKDLAA